MKAIAVIDKRENPNTLSVGGSIITYNEMDTVILRFAIPQGFNPLILLLDVIVTEVEGPKKGTEKHFFYDQVDNTSSFKQVELRYNNESMIVDIAMLA